MLCRCEDKSRQISAGPISEARSAENLRLRRRAYKRQTCVAACRESPGCDVKSDLPISEVVTDRAGMFDRPLTVMASGSTMFWSDGTFTFDAVSQAQ